MLLKKRSKTLTTLLITLTSIFFLLSSAKANKSNEVFKLKIVKDTTIYNFMQMDNPPSYPGGTKAFFKFLSNHFKYPKEAFRHEIEGNVYISFIVEKDGSISNLVTDNLLGYGTDEEVIRIFKLSPKWIPGKIEDENVRATYRIPINFRLN